MKKINFLFISLTLSASLWASSKKEKANGGFDDPVNGYESISWKTPYGDDLSENTFFSCKDLENPEKGSDEILKVEKVPVKDCRAALGFTVHPVDGRVDSRGYGPRHQYAEWPFRRSFTAVSYGIIYYHKKSMADGLHIKLGDEKGFNALLVRSHEGFKGSLRKNNSKLSSPWDGVKICDFDGAQYSSKDFSELIKCDKVSVTDKKDGNTLGDISFLRVGKAAQEKKYPEALTYYLVGEDGIPEKLNYYFKMHFKKDEKVCSFSEIPPSEDKNPPLKRESSGYFHFMIPPLSKDMALGAVRLHLSFSDFKKGERAIISVQDPLSPKRDLISYAFPVSEDGKINAELDFPDQIIPQGKSIWIRIKTSDASILNDAKIILLKSDRQTAMKEYLQYRLFLLKGNFSTRSEPRPYAHSFTLPKEKGKREAVIKNDPKGGEVLREMYESLDELKRLFPGHPLIKTYYDWIYFKEGTILFPKDMDVRPQKKENEKDAPDWAVAIRDGLQELLSISKWWLDNRQMTNGEFGGMVNDDTCLLQQFYGITLISDGETGQRIKKACRTLTELAWKHNLKDGVNILRTDPLHGYEEGINMLSIMPLLSYGDPVDFERLMTSSRSIRRLTFEKDGKRYFKKYFYNDKNMESDEKDYQNRLNFQLLDPATMLVWYNKNKAAADFINSVVKGVIALGKNGKVPEKINVKNLSPSKNTKYVSILGYVLGLPIVSMFINDSASISYLKAFITPEEYSSLEDKAFPKTDKPVWTAQYETLHGLVRRIERDNRRNKRFKYIYTEAEIFTDRIFTDKRAIMMASLGSFLSRNSWAPTQYASYEGFGENFAPLLLNTTQNGLKIAFYNFNIKDISGNVRVWRLENGRYRIDCGPDSNNDGKIDEVKKSFESILARYSVVPVKLPSKQTWIVKITQLEKKYDIRSCADLAISSREIKFDKLERKLNFTVHNIGAKESGKFTVSLYAGDRKIQDLSVENIDAPTDLLPKRKELSFENPPENGKLRIVIDPNNEIQEITKTNNEAAFSFE
jgi:hypothetical protein